MGFFSWKTQNTNRSISNRFSSKGTFKVVMVDNKGNKWFEDDYEGYGVFGGKDFYELVAEMNGENSDRALGIELSLSNKPHIEPNLYEVIDENDDYKWIDEAPETCEYQGYFY